MKRILLAVPITLICCCLALSLSAQKLKEKKDIVYLDDAPQYKLEKSGGNLIKGISYLATSITSDTLVRFNFKSISVPGLPHESIGTFWSYYVVDFAPLGKTLEMDVAAKRNLMDMIQEHHVIADNKLSAEGVDKFMAANQDFQKSRVQIDSVAMRRKILAKDKAYQVYAKTLAPRGRWDDNLTLSGNAIMMGDMMSNLKIGTWKMGTDSNYGTMYHILKPDGKQAASIFFEKGRKRIYTRTDLDGVGYEEFIQSDFTNGHLIGQIKRLVMNGYF